MSREPFAHPLTPEQKKQTDVQITATLPPGTGLSVKRYLPFWDVVARAKPGGGNEYIVTDSSLRGRKPVVVHGPVSRAAAEKWADNIAGMYRATHTMHINDEMGPR